MNDERMLLQRNTGLPTRFYLIDGRAILLLTLWLMHFRWWTFIVCVTGIILLWVAEQRGLNVPSAIRAFRSWLAGPYRPAILTRKRKRRIDYGTR